jgi:hypothetical protein
MKRYRVSAGRCVALYEQQMRSLTPFNYAALAEHADLINESSLKMIKRQWYNQPPRNVTFVKWNDE